MKELKKLYKKLKPDIEKRLAEFAPVWKSEDRSLLFGELCYCLLTPQSKAVLCFRAVSELKKKKLLFNGSANEIKKCLYGVRFANNKASYIKKAGKIFPEIRKIIRLSHKNVPELRRYLVENIKGFGWKEASHFLRNIGLGKDICILDRHILKNLLARGVIAEIPSTVGKKEYLSIEKKMSAFAKKIKIPPAHLDLLLWAKETGSIFK